MNRLIFIRNKNNILSFNIEEDIVNEINVYEDEGNILSNVYVGVVDNIVKNIDAAFVRFDGTNCGYLSMTENRNPMFLNVKNTEKYCQGDLVLVQVQKEAMKLKKPMLTANIEIAGNYCVVIFGKKGINVSSKIKDTARREELLKILCKYTNPEVAIIARTNAADADDSSIESDIRRCLSKLESITKAAVHSRSGTCVYQAEKEYLAQIKNCRNNEIDEIITDDAIIYRSIIDYVKENDIYEESKVRLYEEEYSLMNLYNLERALDEAMRKKVWLKSGAFIVIEPTEALCAIDVNTGKAVKGKKNINETFYNINIEAAKEIARQIRLRNLSGIIIVDFIDMPDLQMRKNLMAYMRELVSQDTVKCNVIDMTTLNLVEITRKKVKAPLHEIYKP